MRSQRLPWRKRRRAVSSIRKSAISTGPCKARPGHCGSLEFAAPAIQPAPVLPSPGAACEWGLSWFLFHHLGAMVSRKALTRRDAKRHGAARPSGRRGIERHADYRMGLAALHAGRADAFMQADLGMSPELAFGGVAAMYLVGALAAPIAGRLIDRCGARWVMGAGSLAAAIGLAWLAHAKGPASYLQPGACSA